MTIRLVVPEQEAGRRLDAFVAASAGLSRARATHLIDGGEVLVNDVPQRKAYRVAAGDVVVVEEPEQPSFEAPGGIEVVYEDEHLLVVSKPAGVVVHPAPGLREGTLVDALAAGGRPLAAGGGPGRPGIVHRLDREVSGLLVVAKTEMAHQGLTSSLARREIERVYLALVHGPLATDRGKIDAPVGRHPRHRTKMAVLPEGKPAVTWFSVLDHLGPVTLLEVTLETGRTHQIRVHLASIGHPVVGDAVYGSKTSDDRLGPGVPSRPFLHAHRLALVHPATSEGLSFSSGLPAELASFLEDLRKRAGGG